MYTDTRHKTSGAAMIIFVLFFAFATSSLMFILGQSMFTDLSDLSQLSAGKRALIVAESATEDVVYRRVFGTFSVDDAETLTLNGATAYATTTYDTVDDIYTIESSTRDGRVIRKSRAELSITAGSAFSYGLQAGNGGITLANNSRIIGNVYANGPVVGSGSSEVLGDAVSAGPSGFAQGIHATGTIYANTIDNVDADADAYYETDLHPTGPQASNIAGTRYVTTSYQPTTTFPISTTTIQQWKDAAASHGTVIAASDPACSTGTYTIDTNITLGWVIIECNVDIEKTGVSTIVTLTGPIWIKGNLSFTNGPELRVDPALGRRSVQFIVDNPADRLTSSQIEIRNSTNFVGSGDSRSYIMLLSENESAANSGTEPAISISQSANGAVIAYTNNGLVEIGNGIDLREITGYQIDVAQNTDVVYEEGLANLLFTSGPGGEYMLRDWEQAE